jgi:hypothetical protein
VTAEPLLEDVSTPPAARTDLERLRRVSMWVGLAGLALSAVGAFISPAQFYRSYLVAYVFVIGIVLGSLAIVMIHHLTGGAWGMVIRRLLESATRTLPLMAVLFIPLLFGLGALYPWARPDLVAHDALLQKKQLYLNVPFFIARAVAYFLMWGAVAYFLNRWSLEQDRLVPASDRRFRLLSAPGLLVYGLTVTFMSIDWVMSLDPYWFSTIFGVLFMGGQGLSAMAFAIAALMMLSAYPPLSNVVLPSHFHDLGKLLLAFVMLWAYFAFSQFLIIWSGNLPEEIPWYLHRLHGGWQAVALLVLLGHFVLPFLMLLSRDLKRNGRSLAALAGGLMLMRLVDLFWIIGPTGRPEHFGLHWLDIAAPVGVTGVWLAFYLRQLMDRTMLPVHDPYFSEALEHGGH